MRLLSSTYLAAVLLGLLTAYLGAVSVLIQVSPELVRRVLGVTGTRAYGHPILLALVAAVCVNLLAASLRRVRPDLPRLGAWCSHAGVLVLVGGACWYALEVEHGDCLTVRAGQWEEIDRFYLQDSFALYVADPRGGSHWQPLGDLQDAPTRNLDLTFSESPGLTIRAKRYIAQAVLTEQWADDCPDPTPAAEVQLTDRRGTQEGLVAPNLPNHQTIEGDGYLLMYHPGATPEAVQKMLANPLPPMKSKVTVLILVRGKDLSPRVVVLRHDGKRSAQEIQVNEPLELDLPEQAVCLTVTRFLDHARTSMTARRAVADELAQAAPALEVEISQPSRPSVTTALPFFNYPVEQAWQHVPCAGGAMGLAFSRSSRPLGQTLQVLQTEYQSYPGSVVPKDYRCEVQLSDAGRLSRQTISLNHPLHVGPYQVSQGSWMPAGNDVQQIVFGVASRPGTWLVYLGMILIGLGFPWAFYVKPLLLRPRGTT